MSTVLRQYFAELQNPSKPIVASKLANLSDLSPEEIHIFREEWPHIDAERRRAIMGLLIDIAADNLELDFDKIFYVCLNDEDNEVKIRAIEGLYDCEDRSLINIFVDTINQNNDNSVRAAAAGALGTFALMAELGELTVKEQQEIENTLITAFNNKNEPVEIRCKALEAISPLSKPPVEEMIRIAYQSDVEELRASSIYAMGRNCNEGWLPLLLKELNSPNEWLKCEAIQACAELESEEAVPRLVQLLSDDSTIIQVAAIEALGHIGGPEAKKALQTLQYSDIDDLQQEVEDALIEIDFWDDPASI